ncbi:unnamed protein product [Lactuca virosa]|uniref:Myb-like domain-containing protein n=1 Tax=Lactuca virosa TaxID=75947 RepID=A0AAU9LZM0_9ASTR|nr:unnamed protein product [Lactuca virosa]
MYMDPGHLLISEGVLDTGGGAAADRFPQWSVQETRELLMVRAELDSKFMETKRNKLLWEVISTKMKERGYNRSGEQCKSKWKNLVTRYKGYETMEQEGTRQQFPFYDELQTIFANRMQRLLWMEAEGVASGSRKREMKFASDNDDSDMEKASGSKITKKKKGIVSSSQCNPEDTSCSNVISNLKEIFEEYMKHEMQWMEWYKAKEEERRMKELEWRQTMEALGKERTMLYERWREREEQRSMREEDRAQKRDALVTALLNKLRSQGL